MDRYIKHINLEEIGLSGQKKFLESKILIVGAGALGTCFINILSRSGIGNITVIDNDKVELSNLQRQNIYDEKDIGKFKIDAIKEHVNNINSEININVLNKKLNSDNVNLCKGYDLIIDATDNFKTRFLINDFCLANGLSWLFTGILNKNAQTILLDKISLEKIIDKNIEYKELENSQGEAILSPGVNAIVSFASTLALRYLLGDFTLNNVLYSFDAWDLVFKRIKF